MNAEQIEEVAALTEDLRAASVEIELHKIASLREQTVKISNYTLAKNKMKGAVELHRATATVAQFDGWVVVQREAQTRVYTNLMS